MKFFGLQATFYWGVVNKTPMGYEPMSNLQTIIGRKLYATEEIAELNIQWFREFLESKRDPLFNQPVNVKITVIDFDYD